MDASPLLVVRFFCAVGAAVWGGFAFGGAGVVIAGVVGFVIAPVPSLVKATSEAGYLVESYEARLSPRALARILKAATFGAIQVSLVRLVLLVIGVGAGALYGRWGVVIGAGVAYALSLVFGARLKRSHLHHLTFMAEQDLVRQAQREAGREARTARRNELRGRAKAWSAEHLHLRR